MKKRKLKKSTKVVIIVVLISVLFGLGVYYIINNFTVKKPVNTEVKVIGEIKDFGYELEENETKLYKKYFKELESLLQNEKIDYKKYAELVSKLYISDFYNLENKITKNDIGGVQFIHSKAVDNFLLKAKDTMYKNIESNVYGDRKQSLPIVSNVEIDSVSETEFTIENKKVDAYKVLLNWKYEKDLGYEDEKEIILVKENEKLSIVETNTKTSS